MDVDKKRFLRSRFIGRIFFPVFSSLLLLCAFHFFGRDGFHFIYIDPIKIILFIPFSFFITYFYSNLDRIVLRGKINALSAAFVFLFANFILLYALKHISFFVYFLVFGGYFYGSIAFVSAYLLIRKKFYIFKSFILINLIACVLVALFNSNNYDEAFLASIIAIFTTLFNFHLVSRIRIIDELTARDLNYDVFKFTRDEDGEKIIVKMKNNHGEDVFNLEKGACLCFFEAEEKVSRSTREVINYKTSTIDGLTLDGKFFVGSTTTPVKENIEDAKTSYLKKYYFVFDLNRENFSELSFENGVHYHDGKIDELNKAHLKYFWISYFGSNYFFEGWMEFNRDIIPLAMNR